jgi:pimeloyl-ACP methyl ester carboxylesterase
MRGWARGPATTALTIVPVIYCFAGGGCSTGYFDLHVHGDDTYSMADHFVERGAVVVAIDHIGIGRSDPVNDLYAITPTLLAGCHDLALRHVMTWLRNENLPAAASIGGRRFAVGLGHSMGGLIATIQQGRHRSFDALVLLGHSGTGLPDVLTNEELTVTGPDLPSIEDEIIRLARARFDPKSTVEKKKPSIGTFFADDVPMEVRQAFADQSAPLLPTCGLTSMIPGSAHAERAAVAVPTFVGFGDQDLIVDYIDALAQYRRVREAALYVLDGSGHCHNQATGRRFLWDRILAWITAISTTATPAAPGSPTVP